MDFGLLLLVVGVVYIANRGIFSAFISWVELASSQGALIRPPLELINSAALFFGLLGGSNFLTAIIRVMIDKVWRRILSDILSGIGLLTFAYLINLYAGYSIVWTNVIALEAVVVGSLIVLYFILRNVFQ